MGKTSIRSSATALYVGYYIERGLRRSEGIKQEYIITKDWHWYGFLRCLRNGSLNELLFDLPDDRRCIWIENNELNLNVRISYSNDSSLREAEHMIEEIAEDNWINVMLGNFYLKGECLDLQQQIVPRLRTPIVRAYEIDMLVRSAT
jgi:hypothetical protein